MKKVLLCFLISLLGFSSCSNKDAYYSDTLYVVENGEIALRGITQKKFNYELSSSKFQGHQRIFVNSDLQWAVGDTIKLINMRIEKDSLIHLKNG